MPFRALYKALKGLMYLLRAGKQILALVKLLRNIVRETAPTKGEMSLQVAPDDPEEVF